MTLDEMSQDDLHDLAREAEAMALEAAKQIFAAAQPAKSQKLYDSWVYTSARQGKRGALTRADAFTAIAMLVAHYLMNQECPDCRRREAAWLVALAHDIIESGPIDGRSIN